MRRPNTARVLATIGTKPAGPQPLPPGHWIIASRNARRPVPVEPQPAPDCTGCITRRHTASQPTSQEVQP